ncbi:mitochondrial peptide methionine sulfoxide reductase isoform X3 [Acipenser ruthenus]|uniref:mitochondrial peptide methionine sulfoxide reductase isoform X3 n=1 Tax=Acipenser ruthenus TaxID=7906 RepID=UPI0027426FEC|nr:mitochondrial peptide methionine sulfoxide reductase isoform X3 [Acipenser ruthenus]
MVVSTRLLLIWRHFTNSRMGYMASKLSLPSKETALPGSNEKIHVSEKHHANGNKTVEPFPEGLQMAMFGMGCFWGAERKFWTQKGVYSTQVGYAGGYTPNPSYEEVCSGMRQGNDTGTQYRSAIYTYTQEQMDTVNRSKEEYQKVLTENEHGEISTEIREAQEFYYAEDYHQQYLSKNPRGYCGLSGTGVSCPIGLPK